MENSVLSPKNTTITWEPLSNSVECSAIIWGDLKRNQSCLIQKWRDTMASTVSIHVPNSVDITVEPAIVKEKSPSFCAVLQLYNVTWSSFQTYCRTFLPAYNLGTLIETCIEDHKIHPTHDGSRIWKYFHAVLLVVCTAVLQRRACWVAWTWA